MNRRILHVCTSIDPKTGGPATALAGLSKAQAASGHSVAIITADDPASVNSIVVSLLQADVKVHAGGPPRGPLVTGARAARLLDEMVTPAQADVVHVHGMWQHAPHAACKAARANTIPYVFRPCGMLDPWSLRQGWLKKRIFMLVRARRDINHAAALHFTSDSERDLTAPLRLKPRGFVIPNGLDWSEFESLPARGTFRKAHPQIGNHPLVVFLGRLHPKKGLNLLLPAFAHCDVTDAMLVLAGPCDAAYQEELAVEIQSLGIGHRVIFTGMLSGARRLEPLVDADIFCLPSYQENFGNVVIEALGCATPVLISDQVNIHSAVRRAGVGIIIRCDEDALRNQLSRLLSDPQARRALAADARPWVERTFQWERISHQVEMMYDEVCGADR